MSDAKKTLLVVEDQDLLRKAVCRVLEAGGFRVLQAENGLVALDRLKENNYAVDLIVSDLNMPEMGGQALAAKLVSMGHGFTFLFLSGYTEDALGNPADGECAHFLEKPFDPKTLLNKVKSILS